VVVAEAAVNLLPRRQAAARPVLMVAVHPWERATAVVPQPAAVREAVLRPREVVAEEEAALARLFAVAA
jgi:hypothetical protein